MYVSLKKKTNLEVHCTCSYLRFAKVCQNARSSNSNTFWILSSIYQFGKTEKNANEGVTLFVCLSTGFKAWWAANKGLERSTLIALLLCHKTGYYIAGITEAIAHLLTFRSIKVYTEVPPSCTCSKKKTKKNKPWIILGIFESMPACLDGNKYIYMEKLATPLA